MSGDDNPFGFDPDRTIVRPNPGLRRPQPHEPPPAPPSSPSPAPISPEHASVDHPREAPRQPVSAPEEFNPSSLGAKFEAPRQEADHRISQRHPSPNAALSHAQALHFADLVAQNENPVMHAAGPLLLLLGRMRVAMLRVSFVSIMEQVAAAVNFFDADIRAAGVPSEQANTAKYLICATADDIVQNIPTEDGLVGDQYSMVSRFCGERIGGARFFQELDRQKHEPAVNYNNLELQHACLALGFQGDYRTSAGGAAQLQLIQRDLYETLRRVRRRAPLQLSQHWRGQDLPLKHSSIRVPIWAVAGMAAFALFDLFLFLRTMLAHDAETTARDLIELHPQRRIVIERRLLSTTAEPTASQQSQLAGIRNKLLPDITNGSVSVEPTGKWIAIRVGNILMFDSGKATLLPQFQQLAGLIAQIIEKETGPVKIIGHTDNQPLSPLNHFKNNQELSLERARAVAEILKPLLSDPSRVVVEGRGPDSPIADNNTAEGRSKNRRVEILIARKD